ncbi:MAG TPA: PAS domain-containing sensor histidine kinase [Ignavibacteria bacterium]|nr:PAS domain-containing sensor histidine kinase [Ignavibacteria bacterium]
MKNNSTKKNNFKNKFEILLNVSEDLIFILNSSGYFEVVNDSGANKLGYNTTDLIGKHFTDLIDSSNAASVSESITKLLNNDETITFQASVLPRDDNNVIYEFNCRSIKENSNIINLIGIGRDITQTINDQNKKLELDEKLTEANRLILLERQRSTYSKSILEELNRLKNEFMSSVSHEMRTPLASIIGFSETIDTDTQMPVEMRKEFNRIILKEGKRLARLINDVLNITKLEGGEIKLEKKRVDIVKLIKDVIKEMKPIVIEEEINLTTDLPEEENILIIDEDKIYQILVELLNNAIKFTPKGGRITVIGQALYKEFEIIISDTGVGIPEKDISFVFQKFYRAEGNESEIEGAGLGLVFVKQIVDLHKGFISIQSDVNKGTSFNIKLPLLLVNQL